MTSVEINGPLQVLIDLLYPGLTSRQQGSQVRADLTQLYKERLSAQPAGDVLEALKESGRAVTVTPELPQEIANRIASKAPAIDNGNWAAIATGIDIAMNTSKWDADDEQRLLDDLTLPFENARNECRVQNSRIKAFFTRHLW